MFQNFTIKQKIVIPLSLIIGLFTVSSVLNVMTTSKQSELSDTLNEQIVPNLFTIEDAYRDLYQATSAVQGIALAETQADIDHHIHEYKDNAYKALPRMEKVIELSRAGVMPASHGADVQKTGEFRSKVATKLRSDVEQASISMAKLLQRAQEHV